jgi:sulfofructose kinase
MRSTDDARTANDPSIGRPLVMDAGPRPRVICLGHTTLDFVWTVDALPHGGGKTPASSYACRGGGMAATAAVAAARLGACAQFWGRAGDDAAGAAMRAELATFGVDATHLRLFQGACSSVSSVVVDASGERMLVNFRGADLPADPAWLPLDTVSNADMVLADPRWPEGALALFTQARGAGVPSILDGDVAEPAVFDALLPHVDYAVFSSEGLARYVGQPRHALAIDKALGAACAKGCRVAAVTLGDRGVAWLDGTTIQHLPAFAVDVVDTNGAGDVFHGALAFALGARWRLRDALLFSSAAAALKCTRAGPRNGVPDFASTTSFLGSG